MTKRIIAIGRAANGEPYTVESATAQMLADLAIADLDAANRRVLALTDFAVEAGMAAFRATTKAAKAGKNEA